MRLGYVTDSTISQASFGSGAVLQPLVLCRHSCQMCSQIKTSSVLRAAKQNSSCSGDDKDTVLAVKEMGTSCLCFVSV